MEELNSKISEIKIVKKPAKKIKIKKRKLCESCSETNISNKYRLKIVVKKIIFLMRYQKQRIDELQNLQSMFRENTQKWFAVGYMIKHSFNFVNQGEMLHYCDSMRNKVTNGEHKGYRDNSRGIESLRKNKYPLRWIEIIKNNILYLKYIPQKEQWEKDAIIVHANKNCGFTKKNINEKLELCNYKCELTGLSIDEGKLAADHWNPKEKGGESTKKNCVIINKILNEKKNNIPPLEWFCNYLLNNFMNICKKTDMDIENVKKHLIKYITEW